MEAKIGIIGHVGNGRSTTLKSLIQQANMEDIHVDVLLNGVPASDIKFEDMANRKVRPSAEDLAKSLQLTQTPKYKPGRNVATAIAAAKESMRHMK